MANPIIKIKRGIGKPPTWTTASGGSGITAGEFALDTNTGVLYVGMLGSGGYTGHFGTPSSVGSTVPNVVPIGYQISNDAKFGGSSPTINTVLGYSQYTVPSTYAVKQFVSEAIIAAAAGIDFISGEGIALNVSGITYTVTNTGVLKGFTSTNAIGNAVGDTVKAKSARDGITFIGGGGILLTTSNANGSVKFDNIGITSIGGFTGDITTIDAIRTLTGFTASIGLANREVITATTPIVVTNSGGNSIDISHAASGSGSGTVNAFTNGVPQLLTIKYNATGHIESIAPSDLNFTVGKPAGLTEAVQDAAYPGITTGVGPVPPHSKAYDYGVYFAYDDDASLLRAYNTGITSIGLVGGVGLSGPVQIAPTGTMIQVLQNTAQNRLTINYAGTQYNQLSANKPTTYSYPDSGIYIGGVTGAGTQTAAAALTNDELRFLAGRGIGISAGTAPGTQTNTVLLWNTGVNMLSAYDSGGNLLGGTGFSGSVNLVAGTNIQLARGSGGNENTLTISSIGGGGGGAVAYIQADYTTEVSENYSGTYSGPGVTGAIELIGLNGIVTKQDTATNSGDLYVGLSSKLQLPSTVFLGGTPAYPYPEITIPTARATAIPPLPHCGMEDYFALPDGYSRLTTDLIEGGLTAALRYGDQGGSIFNPPVDNVDLGFSEPGKILILRAREGVIDPVGGGSQNMSGLHTEVRLLAYPNPENMVAYIQEGMDAGTVNASCPGGNCVGYPPTFPACFVDGQQTWYGYTKNDATHNNIKGSVVVHSDLIAQDSVYVNKDIWLTGDLINATTGCLYQVQGGGGVNTPGGNLGLTGDLIVQGSIYVHGGTAFFNVRDLSTESALISIGGISASTGYSNPYDSIATTQSGYTGDRGLILHTYSKLPYSPLLNEAESGAGIKRGFVGVDASEGTFKYVADAELETLSSGNNVYTYVKAGRLGPAQFSELNGVGITSDGQTLISLRAGQNAVATNFESVGHARIIASTSSANKSFITLGSNATVLLGTNSNSIIEFARGITFDATSNTSQFGGEANALRIRYNGQSDSVARHITIRNPGATRHTQLVDTGKAGTTDSGLGTVDLAQQVIYNKTLADGTIIDCGGY